jgi:hypothetical protein
LTLANRVLKFLIVATIETVRTRHRFNDEVQRQAAQRNFLIRKLTQRQVLEIIARLAMDTEGVIAKDFGMPVVIIQHIREHHGLTAWQHACNVRAGRRVPLRKQWEESQKKKKEQLPAA